MSDQLTGPVTIMENPMTEKRPYGMNNVLVVIDLGNGEVNSKVKVGNTEKWIETSFPSVVAENFDGGFSVNNRKVVVGEYATKLRCSLTGKSATGKVDNALPLLVNVLKETVGFDNPLKVNVVFGCPSVKEYGDDIKAQLVGIHTVKIEGDPISLTDDISQRVQVATVVPQLEGYQAHRMIPAKSGKVRYIADIGNRTVILTAVNDKGGIVSRDHRKQIDGCGVQSIAQKVSESEGLVGLPHAPRIPSPQSVINYLLDTKFTANEQKAVEARINPFLGACLDEAADWVAERISSGDTVHLIGGGARIPGVADLFEPKAKVTKNSSWATVNGLCKIADELISRAK